MDLEKAAAGIHKIVNNNMADQVRRVSVYKGYDPRNFSLIAFGGAGPVAAGRLIQILGLKEAIIPPTPGVLSAFGLLAADIEHEEVATYPVEAAKVNPEEIEKVLRRLEALCEQKKRGGWHIPDLVGCSPLHRNEICGAVLRAGSSFP